VSTASPPPLVKKIFAWSSDERVAMRSASSSAGGVAASPKIDHASSVLICAATASAISARP
jgi:hypothetical protein